MSVKKRPALAGTKRQATNKYCNDHIKSVSLNQEQIVSDFSANSLNVEGGQAVAGSHSCGSAAAKAASPLLLGEGKCQNREKLEKSSGFVGLHWLQGTVPYDRLEKVLDYLVKIFDSEPVSYSWGRFRYNNHYEIEPYGVCLYYDSSLETALQIHNGRCCIVIPGQALDSLDADTLFDLVKTLHYRFWFLGTRTDIYFDDYRRRITPEQVYKEAEAGNISGFRRVQLHSGAIEVGKPDIKDGSGVAFGTRGKRGSGKYLRIYDKNLESKGENSAIRWEIESSKEKAQEFACRLAQCISLEEFAGILGGLIVGCIDFINRSNKNEHHLDRLQRLEWWQSIIDELGEIKLRNKQRPKSVDKAIGWVEKSVSATLGMIKLAVGDRDFIGWIEKTIKDGEGNLSVKQKALIKDYKEKWGNNNDLPELQEAI